MKEFSFFNFRSSLILILLNVVGCVGPTTPFGAVSLFKRGPASLEDGNSSVLRPTARVRFTPERQVLHGPTTFSVIIEDPDGVPDDFHLKVTYNDQDVTQQFLSQAEVTSADPLRHELRLSAHFLRLLPMRSHKVKVAYKHDADAKAVTAEYLPPTCSALANNQMVFTVPEFEAPLTILQLINRHAVQKKLNPYFVAALVAQESGFDSRALSSNHAMGLTQVTALGEAEIIRKFADWPRYPGVSEIPYPLLKLQIAGGRIHSGNEWRLDPALSIQGGVEYLSYLSEYWSRPEKRAQIEKNLGPSETALSEVVLASYNSGATRVSNALESDGKKWLENEELGEAQKYVRRVVSYCDYFEHRRD